MFSAPERPTGSMDSRKVGEGSTPSNVPTFQLSASVGREGIGFHRRAHAHEIAVPVRPVHAPDRGPHLVLAGRGRGGPRPPPRGGGGPPGGRGRPARVGGGWRGGGGRGVAGPVGPAAVLSGRGPGRAR